MRKHELLNELKLKAQESRRINERITKMIAVGNDKLAIKKGKNHFIYYAMNTKTKQKQYLNKNIDTIKDLELQNYYEKLSKATETNIQILAKIEKLFGQIVEPGDVFYSIKEEKRHLIKPFTEGYNHEYIHLWKEKTWVKKPIAEDKYFYTSQGIQVRSKSELIISERLINADIPFFYEYPVSIDKRTIWHPDFLVLNKRTKEEYYWEHLGMMDEEEYRNNSFEKLEKYAEIGIIAGKNLIITMESTKHQLNTKYIDTIIKQFLM